MTEKAAIRFFVGESVAHARALPLECTRNFLKGMLLCLDEESEETAPLRSAYQEACVLDDSLKKLQLNLQFQTKEATS